MQLVSVDTHQAYNKIRDMIITLELKPGTVVNEQVLAEQLDLGHTPVREALKLLVHDNLVEIKKHQGLYVSEINKKDLEMLSEVSVLMEGYAARLATDRATEDDITIMEALIDEQKDIPDEDKQAWFEIDHKLHQAIAAAAHNRYLSESLEYYFLLSQRLWYLVLPKIQFLSLAVHEHADLVKAIQNRNPGVAENIMTSHVQSFYNKVREIIELDE
ncbi:MAG: GntR family transcriptional regulator [Anaerolineales bacterium]